MVRTEQIAKRFFPLRSWPDWQTVYYSTAVSRGFFEAAKQDLELTLGPARFRFESRVTPGSVVAQSDGWHMRLLDPSLPCEEGKLKVYPVELQAQGRAWAGGIDLEDALESFEAAASLQGAKRIPGRVDLCADVWIQDGEPSAEELYNTIVSDGSLSLAAQSWATRAKRSQLQDTSPDLATRFVGGARKSPITQYIGSRKGIQLVVYQKSADFAGNTADALHGLWRSRGWDGTGIVVRFEFAVSRDVVRRTNWPLVDDETGECLKAEGSEIDLAGLRENLGALWVTCLRRFRWCPWDGKTHAVRNREPAPLWRALEQLAPSFGGRGSGQVLTFCKRRYAIEALRLRVLHGLVNLEEAQGRGAAMAAAMELNNPSKELAEYRAHTPWSGFRERMQS